MSKRRLPIGKLFLALCLALGVAAAYRQSLIPPSLSPLPALDLGNPKGWTGGLLVDWQLAELRRSPKLCARVLRRRHIKHRKIADKPFEKRCGWHNAVAVSAAGGARLSANPLTCQMAAAITVWIEHEVQPLARQHFGSRVKSVQTMGTYSCRNIVGNKIWKDLRSQHAFANALDIAGFRLANGKKISVLRHWKGDGRKAKFLRAIHRRACRYFRVVLGPDFNPAHRDHFHFDRGSFWTCK